MNFKALTEHRFFRPAVGAGLAALCGLALWQMRLGQAWINASYDYLFLFGATTVTNKVVLVLMDNDAYDKFRQRRGAPWDRELHTKLLNRLARDECPLVVFDVFFGKAGEPEKDRGLAEVLRRQRCVVLMAEQAGIAHPDLVGARPTLPTEPFLSAANTNWGVAWLDPDVDLIVRRHWPFPAPGPYPSLPWTAARLAGARLPEKPQEQWLRYFGEKHPWISLGYDFALTQATNYFRDKIVFIGSEPATSVPDGEIDEFRTPYTRWRVNSAGGVEILATMFLNLMNGDWLRRPADGVEVLLLIATGALLGAGLCCVRPLMGCALATGISLLIGLGAVSLSYFTNFWFPWLIIVGGQLPCALVWALATAKVAQSRVVQTIGPEAETEAKTAVISATAVKPADLPDTPDYELFEPPFGEGAYGKVWLARNAIGQWQALKAVYQARFHDAEPYEREFRGIKRYKPISDLHPGLLRVDFVSRKKAEGYFYYVMELGDAMESGWEEDPAKFKPRDLASVRREAEKRRLPVQECLGIVLALAEALDFLHRQGLIHRDIKPQNIIFVKGGPKLADVGLVAEIRPPDRESTWVGTPGYMPPPPEPPGTVQADIYALGMVLYVISTGHAPAFFPELSTSLAERTGPEFILLNSLILKACQPDCSQRYRTAGELRDAVLEVQRAIESNAMAKRA